MGQGPPGNRTRNYQSATHFYSKDGGARWAWTGDSAGVVASCDPLSPKGQACPGKEAPDDCPDDLGVYSGSTTYVDGVPNYAYPGVHLYNYAGPVRSDAAEPLCLPPPLFAVRADVYLLSQRPLDAGWMRSARHRKSPTRTV